MLEDDRVAEVYLERPERRSIAGNIYLGTVDNVLPGMEAAFVEIGLEKNGFLYVDEIVVPELEGKRHGKKITDLIARGQQILVQAVKDPMKTKGARLTTEISLPGRFLVYVPHGEGLGVSRRLDDDERARLKDIIKGLDVEGGRRHRPHRRRGRLRRGHRARPRLPAAALEDDPGAARRPRRRRRSSTRRPSCRCGSSATSSPATSRARRSTTSARYKRIVGYLKKTSPHMVERVHRYKEKTPLFEGTGVDAEIRSTLNRRVDLPSGGYLIFDYAEAFTVIDVNTGRFVGSRSKNSTGRLEDTITKNNLEAVKEVVRQLRLRDIGGIIVIDFIDMANPKNRATVEEALRTELERDRTKTYVVEISPLGLVEMTRQNVTDGPREILTRKCPTCAGDGIVVSEATAAIEVERRLRTLAAGSRAQAFRVEVNPRTCRSCSARAARGSPRSRRRRRSASSSSPKEGVHADHAAVLAEGKLVDLQPPSAGRRGHRGRAEARRGRQARRRRRGRQARRDRRRRRRRREARRQEGEGARRARARRRRLRDGAERRRGARRADHVRERGREADARAEPREEGGRDETSREVDGRGSREADGAEVEEPSRRRARGRRAGGRRRGCGRAVAEAAPAKKKTRRGSRGGRSRKKKPAAARPTARSPQRRAEAGRRARRRRCRRRRRASTSPTSSSATKPRGTQADAEAEAAGRAPRTARARRPSRSATAVAEETDGAEATAPAKKKTRRGSRGGRNRKKPAGGRRPPRTAPSRPPRRSRAGGARAAEAPRPVRRTAPMSRAARRSTLRADVRVARRPGRARTASATILPARGRRARVFLRL